MAGSRSCNQIALINVTNSTIKTDLKNGSIKTKSLHCSWTICLSPCDLKAEQTCHVHQLSLTNFWLFGEVYKYGDGAVAISILAWIHTVLSQKQRECRTVSSPPSLLLPTARLSELYAALLRIGFQGRKSPGILIIFPLTALCFIFKCSSNHITSFLLPYLEVSHLSLCCSCG